jgi:hypothetical protein
MAAGVGLGSGGDAGSEASGFFIQVVRALIQSVRRAVNPGA